MATKKTLMLEYSDWLFEDRSSIIYEQRRGMADGEERSLSSLVRDGNSIIADYIREYVSNPEHVADIGQMIVGFAGAIPVIGPAFDIGNAAVYALRGQFGAAVIQLIAVIPAIGDAVGTFVSGLQVFFRGAGGTISRTGLPAAGEIARVLSSLATNEAAESYLLAPAVRHAVQSMVDWISTNIAGLRQAFNVTKAYADARVTLESIPAGDMERRGVSATFIPLVRAILSNVNMTEAFRNVFSGLNSGIESASEMATGFHTALNALQNSSAAARTATSSTTTPPRAPNAVGRATWSSPLEESYTEIRFKKLAGILK